MIVSQSGWKSPLLTGTLATGVLSSHTVKKPRWWKMAHRSTPVKVPADCQHQPPDRWVKAPSEDSSLQLLHQPQFFLSSRCSRTDVNDCPCTLTKFLTDTVCERKKKMVVFTSLKFLRFRGSGISCVVLQVHAAHLLPLDLLSRHPCTQGACSTVLIATNQH